MRYAMLVSVSMIVLFLLGVAAAAAAAAAGGKTKNGLGATGSDTITINSKNFKETVSLKMRVQIKRSFFGVSAVTFVLATLHSDSGHLPRQRYVMYFVPPFPLCSGSGK